MGELPRRIRAIMLTFLAGTEIDSNIIRKKLGPSVGIGVASFTAPYVGVLLWATTSRVAGRRRKDRRDSRFYHVGCRRLCGDGRRAGSARPSSARSSSPPASSPTSVTVLALGIVFAHFDALKAGSLVKFDAIVSAAGLILVFLSLKMITKFLGVLPLTRLYEFGGREGNVTRRC